MEELQKQLRDVEHYPIPKLPASEKPFTRQNTSCVSIPGLTIGDAIGSGTYGTAYRACKFDAKTRRQDCQGSVVKVVRIQRTADHMQNLAQLRNVAHEVAVGVRAGVKGYGPFIDWATLCNHGNEAVISMERMSGPIRKPVDLGRLLTVVNRMHADGVFHQDLFKRNVMMKGNEYKIIDYGMAFFLGPGRVSNLLRACDVMGLVFGHSSNMNPRGYGQRLWLDAGISAKSLWAFVRKATGLTDQEMLFGMRCRVWSLATQTKWYPKTNYKFAADTDTHRMYQELLRCLPDKTIVEFGPVALADRMPWGTWSSHGSETRQLIRARVAPTRKSRSAHW